MIAALLALALCLNPETPDHRTFVLEHYVSGETVALPRRPKDAEEKLFWRKRRLGIVRDSDGTTVDVWTDASEGARIRVHTPMFSYVYDANGIESLRLHFRSPEERDSAIGQFVRDAAARDEELGFVNDKEVRLSDFLDWRRPLAMTHNRSYRLECEDTQELVVKCD